MVFLEVVLLFVLVLVFVCCAVEEEASSSSFTLTRVVSRSFQGRRREFLVIEAVLAATAADKAAADKAALEEGKAEVEADKALAALAAETAAVDFAEIEDEIETRGLTEVEDDDVVARVGLARGIRRGFFEDATFRIFRRFDDAAVVVVVVFNVFIDFLLFMFLWARFCAARFKGRLKVGVMTLKSSFFWKSSD